MRNLKLKAALAAATRGIPVFPLRAGSKHPAIQGWPYQATLDPVKITRWWEADPDINIGGHMEGLIGIDLDVKKNGIANWETWLHAQEQEGRTLPPTYVQRTASGGLHLIFALDTIHVRNSVSKLAQGVDVRGRGGFLVMAGSKVPDKMGILTPYEVIEDRLPALAPDWLIEACGRPADKAKNAGERLIEETPAAVAKAWALSERWPAGDDPDAGDDAAYRHAAALGDIGVEKDTALEILQAWSGRLDDPIDDERLEQKVENAYAYRQKAIGIDSPDAPSGFTPLYENAPEEPQPRAKLTRLRAKESAARALEYAAEPLIKGLLDVGTLSVLYGESNTGKSFVAMDQDFHIATGKEWMGRRVKTGPVVWIAAEGGAGVHKRVRAWMQRYEVEDPPFHIIPSPVDLLHETADLEPLIEMLAEISKEEGAPIAKITIDTLSRVLAGGDENSSKDMGVLVKRFDKLRAATGAHVMVIHHSGKDAAKGARGHSLLRAATDTEIEIKGGRLTVRKQRDLDSEVWYGIKLKCGVVGEDQFHEEVTSCTVDFTQSIEVLAANAEAAAEKERAELTVIYQKIKMASENLGKPTFSQTDLAEWLGMHRTGDKFINAMGIWKAAEIIYGNPKAGETGGYTLGLEPVVPVV